MLIFEELMCFHYLCEGICCSQFLALVRVKLQREAAEAALEARLQALASHETGGSTSGVKKE